MTTEAWFDRTKLLIGNDKLIKLNQAHVLVAGLGGVGSATAEMLCRAGIGKLSLVDFDSIHPSNRNRQLIALTSTEGRSKVETLSDRLRDINPEVEIIGIKTYITEDTLKDILAVPYDFVVDAIDTLSPKVTLISETVRRNLKLVSSLGSGGRIDPTRIMIADISDTHHCKFGYLVRKKLHKLDIETGFRAVFSSEMVPRSSIKRTEDERNKKSIAGTISYMPIVFGCFCAYEVIDTICNRSL
jgi:tRNA threonylcarbamoyladenosine dehydratase